jgi:hypothetical protein
MITQSTRSATALYILNDNLETSVNYVREHGGYDLISYINSAINVDNQKGDFRLNPLSPAGYYKFSFTSGRSLVANAFWYLNRHQDGAGMQVLTNIYTHVSNGATENECNIIVCFYWDLTSTISLGILGGTQNFYNNILFEYMGNQPVINSITNNNYRLPATTL